MDVGDFTGKQVGRYLLTSLLGIGAAGSIYRAIDSKSKNSPKYAIKCVPESSHAKRHAQQLAEIANHNTVVLCPNVLTLYEVIKEDGYLFLVMPLCETDMFVAIREKLYWRNDALIKKAFVQILDGVLACHKKGVFHRDLKPENIMCSAEGTKIRIGDFGLSTSTRTPRDGGCGTLPYMSPECFHEFVVFYYADAADIWSLGIILFNMVTGLVPWKEADAVNDKHYKAFLSNRKRFLRAYSISDGMKTLFCKILNPTPMRRMSIPAIRQAVMGMETFYTWERSSCVVAPLSPKKAVLVDSDETCVAPTEDLEKAKSISAAIDVLDETFSHIDLRKIEV